MHCGLLLLLHHVHHILCKWPVLSSGNHRARLMPCWFLLRDDLDHHRLHLDALLPSGHDGA